MKGQEMADSKKIDDGGPAFQVFRQHALGRVENDNNGMSLRDWFAGQFLAGAATSKEPLAFRGNPSRDEVDAALRSHWDDVSRAAFIAADAMIAARKAGA
ncbi:hypothetical protein [Agrobacterium tumefaciens]|uniref:hypothetical protein n=1 Tax=Agrobacterium tumefaciens TaxID=358 RepID=UPI003B9F6426